MVNKKAIKLINNKEYEQANKISFILFQKKNIDEFLEINNLLLEEKLHTCTSFKRILPSD